MTYVGAIPTTGDFKLLDSITTSSTTTFNLRQGGVAVYPQSANHCIVQLNGVNQVPTSSFNIVNDTIVFASSLSSDDVINQILVLGNVNDIGVPSDDTVSTAKLQSSAVTDAKISAMASSKLTGVVPTANLGSGTASSSTFLRGDQTYAEAGGGKINQLLNTTAIVNTTTSSDAELMSLAITPSATSSKIYMLFTGTCQMGADEYGSWDFYRGSLASGSKILDGGETVFNGYNNIRLGFSMSFLDSPNTTSATTYTVVGSAVIGSIQYGATGRNTLTLMEVLA